MFFVNNTRFKNIFKIYNGRQFSVVRFQAFIQRTEPTESWLRNPNIALTGGCLLAVGRVKTGWQKNIAEY